MRSRSSGVRDDTRDGHRLDLVLRGVGEINTLSGIEWLREVAREWLPDVSPDRARIERAIETRAAVIRDAEAARPILDFNWAAWPGPMDRIIDRLQQRGPRLVRDDGDQDPTDGIKGCRLGPYNLRFPCKRPREARSHPRPFPSENGSVHPGWEPLMPPVGSA